jgi:hypothetical protein
MAVDMFIKIDTLGYRYERKQIVVRVSRFRKFVQLSNYFV